MQLTPYLNFNGNCKEAFQLYEQCFRGKIVALFTYADAPPSDHITAESRDRIMHARLLVGDAVLMGSDCPVGHYQEPRGLYVSLGIDSPAEAERIFHTLAEGGKVDMPIGETFFASRFGMLTDRFGTPWMILCEKAA